MDSASTLKKKRTQTSRRPKPEGQSLPDHSALSSPLVFDDTGKVLSDEIVDGNSSGKMFNLNQCLSRSSHVESVPCNGASEGGATENAQKKERLKVGGVTKSIHTKSDLNGPSSNRAPAKGNHHSDIAHQRQKLTHQGNSAEHQFSQMDKKSNLQGVRWKDFTNNFSTAREDVGTNSTRNAVDNKVDKSDAVRKSKRVRKGRANEDFIEDSEDDEIRYLEKLKTSKTGYKDLDAQMGRMKKYRPVERNDEEEGSLSDSGHDSGKRKKPKKDPLEVPTETKKEVALTTRQRALLSKEDPSSVAGACQIEFPDGLPPAPSRKRKVKLSESEQQVKKAEAAQRRKLLNEKAARETEEEAIRKILGQDSNRKKREEKIKKRQELAKEKMASALLLASSTIRTIMGPQGTTVTFPREMGFPKIFDPNPSTYPPPRETCAGPACRNPYKYRDSKSRLPLCSLQCYKAIHECMEV